MTLGLFRGTAPSPTNDETPAAAGVSITHSVERTTGLEPATLTLARSWQTQSPQTVERSTATDSTVGPLAYSDPMEARDTTSEAQQRQLEVYRTMSGPDRVQLAIDMAEETKQITLDGFRARNPELDDAGLLRHWLRLLHGDLSASWDRSSAALHP